MIVQKFVNAIEMSEKDKKKAMDITESDNEYIKYFKAKQDLQQTDIEKAIYIADKRMYREKKEKSVLKQ